MAIKSPTTTSNKTQMANGAKSFNQGRADNGIVEVQFIDGDLKKEFAARGYPFCIADVVEQESTQQGSNGICYNYKVLVPKAGKLIPMSFLLGWNKQREADYHVIKEMLQTQSHIHSCKLITRGKPQAGKNPYYYIDEASDEDGCFYCIGDENEGDYFHPEFPVWVSEDDVVDSKPISDKLNGKSLTSALGDDLDI